MTFPVENRKCLICHKPVSGDFRLFCSSRCQQIDLGYWFNESYVIKNDENADYIEKNDILFDQED